MTIHRDVEAGSKGYSDYDNAVYVPRQLGIMASEDAETRDARRHSNHDNKTVMVLTQYACQDALAPYLGMRKLRIIANLCTELRIAFDLERAESHAHFAGIIERSRPPSRPLGAQVRKRDRNASEDDTREGSRGKRVKLVTRTVI